MIVSSQAHTPRLCQTGKGGILYRLPHLLNCTSQQFEEVTAVVSKKNIQTFETPITGLRVLRKTCVTRVGFLGDKNQEKSASLEVLPEKAVGFLFQKGGCVDPQGNQTNTLVGNTPECKSNWMRTTTTENMECTHYIKDVS